MNLYIHFGIYKTGSSFLQTMCAQNRAYLQKQDYHFPLSNQDKLMLTGRISEGNSQDLPFYLKSGDITNTITLLRDWQNAAHKVGCSKILISAESIIHAFAAPKGLNTLFQAISKTNIKQVSAMGFFRDPVEHCLSTYKHRAKRGTIPNFSTWVKDTYETLRVMDRFLNLLLEYPVDWHFRKYQKDGRLMACAFFEDWMQVTLPDVSNQKSVNPSLSLSELQLIRCLYDTKPESISYVYEEWLGLSKSEKQKDSELEKLYRNQAALVLRGFGSVVDKMNSHLPIDEQLILLQPSQEYSSDYPISVNLSEIQLHALCRGLERADRLEEKMKRLLKKPFRQILNVIQPRKKSVLYD